MFDYKTGQERSDEFIDDYDKFNYYDYISEVTYHNLKYFYFVLTVIDILFSQMSGGSSIILRISYYLSIFYIYAIPNEIEVWPSRSRSILQIVFIVGCLSYWYYMFVLNNYNETVPFIFNPMLF